MFLFKKTVTVQLRKTLSGVIISSYRVKGRKRNFYIDFIPYSLAMYLGLMPDGNSLKFTRKLYNFSHEELDNLGPNNEIVKVTRKNGVVWATIDLSKCT